MAEYQIESCFDRIYSTAAFYVCCQSFSPASLPSALLQVYRPPHDVVMIVDDGCADADAISVESCEVNEIDGLGICQMQRIIIKNRGALLRSQWRSDSRRVYLGTLIDHKYHELWY